MMTETSTDLPGPYARSAAAYWAAGWHGVLPLPPRRKANPPNGWTGRDGPMPTMADVIAWASGPEGDGNIGLRLPRTVIGIDVDNYGAKTGSTELAAKIALWGPLPPTWVTSSRHETGSGISLYRVPEGLQWPGEVGPAIEIIQYRHRYAVCWPSIHPEGRTYHWQSPSGVVVVAGDIPRVDELPELPQRWVDGLTGGASELDITRDTAVSVHAWIVEHGAGEPCRAMKAAIEGYRHELANPTASRHDIGKRATARIAKMMGEGHPGGNEALYAVQEMFLAAIGRTASRPEDAGEWHRLVAGAVQIAATRPVADYDPCSYPFAGLVTNEEYDLAMMAIPPRGAAVTTTEPFAVSADGVEAQVEVRERTSWWPRDLEPILAGVDTSPPAEFLRRQDGGCLLYAGKINGIIGESESGKSFIALLAVIQALTDGYAVTYVDFEDVAETTIARLRDLGCSDDLLRSQFNYIGPQEGLSMAASGDLSEHLATHNPRLIVLDGFNAAMTLLDLDLISNPDVIKFAQAVLWPLVSRGACLVYVDHVPKSKDNESKGGIGAQAKRAMTTGCTLKAEVLVPFGRGRSGQVKLTVDKDRPGYVRGGIVGNNAGTFTVNAHPDGLLDLSITPPDMTEKKDRSAFKPTRLMEQVSAFLASLDGGVSTGEIKRNIVGEDGMVIKAINALVNEAYVARSGGGPGKPVIHTHIRPYIEAEALISDEPMRPVRDPCEPMRDARGTTSKLTHAPMRLPEGDARVVSGVLDSDDEVDPDEGDDETPIAPEPIELHLPGGDETVRIIRESRERGGKPIWMNGQLVDTITGEVLAEK